MLDDRKAAILSAIVEEYIQTAQPVGSSHVVVATGIPVSSATIRNDMAFLEREGFLAQPHTSAGRVPTEKGYRFFVDHLAQPDLGSMESRTVRQFFDRAHTRLEEMLADTSRLLSSLTSYAGVVVAPQRESATVRSVQVVGLGGRLAVVVVVLSDGAVDRYPLDVDPDVSDVDLGASTARLAGLLVGRPLAAPVTVVPTGNVVVDHLVDQVVGLLQDDGAEAGGRMFVGGAANVATAFDAMDTVRSILGVLEEQYVVVSLIRDIMDRGLRVAIGSETGVEPLAECSIVVAPYTVDGTAVGSIGVLGPTRMNYPQALAAVAVVSKRLGNRLSEG
ncbi:MAG: heat-inducible transcription repressor HrcA [Actinobacteria bacterium]|nr:heat-inducible transcription repressor HrcA [Actinomycetota bacterium]